MYLNYTVNKGFLPKVKYNSEEVKMIIMEQYNSIFNATCYILNTLFNVSFLEVNLESQNKYYNLVMSVNLKIKTQYGNFDLYISEDKFNISNSEGAYTFKVFPAHTGDVISLEEMVNFQKDKIIKESFSAHQLNIEIHFVNSGKVLDMRIPIDVANTFDLDLLSYFKEDSNLNDLIYFYRKMFFNWQSDFDKKNNYTVLSIWQKFDNFKNYTNKGVQLDEVLLRDGFIQNYQLGSIKMDQFENKVVVLYKDGIYTISGYYSDSSIDLKDEIQLLERRKGNLG